jgi:hypothetical protein
MRLWYIGSISGGLDLSTDITREDYLFKCLSGAPDLLFIKFLYDHTLLLIMSALHLRH